jgi:hypothetical protein
MTTRLGLACLRLAAALAAWAFIAWTTGGLTIWIGEVRLLSARGVRNPLLLALIAAGVWWWQTPAGTRAAVLRAEVASAGRGVASIGRLVGAALWRGVAAVAGLTLAFWRRLAPWTPAAAASAAIVGVILVGFLEGIFVVGGADSWGYVSQAQLWTAGTLRLEEPLIRELDGMLPAAALAPLGYTPSVGQDALVPVYAPGYPMVMAVFARLGGPEAVFYVLPLLAGLTVGMTYLLGRAIGGPAVGATGALLVATSPAFLYQLTGAPMSDIPAAAWWTLALTLVIFDRTSAAAVAGLAAGLAILTRPNLVPLAVVPAALLAWPIVRNRRLDRTAVARVALFAAGVGAGCLAVAALNTHWYGAPTASGYGSLDRYFSWQHWRMNIERYPMWLVETHTPIIAAALAGPFLVRRRATMTGARVGPVAIAVTAAAFAGVVFGCYLFYTPFDAWWYLRFLLPAFPIVMVFLAMAIHAFARLLPFGTGAPVAAALIGVLAWNGYAEARDRFAFTTESERKYALIGRHAGRLPERAVLLALQHSGSARYYSGRPTLRWDLIQPRDIEPVLARLRELGYEPYFLLEAWEVADFRRHFAQAGPIGALDWAPVAHLPLGNIRIFHARPGWTGVTETVADP